MKQVLLSSFIFVIYAHCFGQTITPNVLISAGDEFKNSFAQISWTLGDFQTTTYSKNDLTLTQGFLQSNFNITGVLNIEKTSDINIKVYPNPVKDILNIQIQSNSNSIIQWELINQSGKMLKTGNNSEDLTNSQINFSSFNNGIYFIRTYKKDGSYVKVFKVVYLN